MKRGIVPQQAGSKRAVADGGHGPDRACQTETATAAINTTCWCWVTAHKQQERNDPRSFPMFLRARLVIAFGRSNPFTTRSGFGCDVLPPTPPSSPPKTMKHPSYKVFSTRDRPNSTRKIQARTSTNTKPAPRHSRKRGKDKKETATSEKRREPEQTWRLQFLYASSPFITPLWRRNGNGLTATTLRYRTATRKGTRFRPLGPSSAARQKEA